MNEESYGNKSGTQKKLSNLQPNIIKHYYGNFYNLDAFLPDDNWEAGNADVFIYPLYLSEIVITIFQISFYFHLKIYEKHEMNNFL